MPSDKKDKDRIFPETPHLILCEGADAYYFLIHLLAVFVKKDSFFNLFRVYDFGGIGELRQYLRTKTKMDEFKKIVRSISIIRDAETSAADACQSIKDTLKDSGFAVPEIACSWTNTGSASYPDIRTGFVLFPSCDGNPQNGTLEDLCLRILAKTDADTVVSDADVALEPYKPELKRFHKNHLHTYFSLTNEFVSMKVGEAARARAFRYDSPEIESLKSFLAQRVS